MPGNDFLTEPEDRKALRFRKEILVEFSVFCYGIYRKIQCFYYVELSASDAA